MTPIKWRVLKPGYQMRRDRSALTIKAIVVLAFVVAVVGVFGWALWRVL